MKITPKISLNINFSNTKPFLGTFAPKFQFVSHIEQDTFEKRGEEINFKGHRCSTEEFKIKQFYGVPCPCCGKIMLLNNQVNSFSRNVVKKYGNELADELSKYDEIYRPIEKEAVEIIKNCARENPELGFKEIIELENEFLKENLEKEQIEILKSLKGNSSGLKEEEKRIYESFIDENIELINSNNKDKHFKRKTFLRDFEALVCAINIPQKEEIKEKALSLPSSASNVYAFFAKYSRRTAEETAKRLVKPAGATTEHIVPQSKGGLDSTENYLLECNECNSKRGNMDFLTFFSSKPDMETHLQKYLDDVAEKIKTSGFEEYESYVEDIISTILRVTNGEVALKKPEIKEKSPIKEPKKEQKQPTTAEEERERVEKLAGTIAEQKHKISTLKARRDELLDNEEFQKYAYYKKLQNLVESSLEEMQAATKEHRRYLRKISKKDRRKETEHVPTREEAKKIAELQQQAAEKKLEWEKILKIREEFLKSFDTPDYLQQKLRELRTKIDRITVEKRKADELEARKAGVKALKARMAELLNIISEKKREIELRERTFNPESPENKAAARQYNIVHEKLKILEKIDPNIYRSYFKETPDIQRDFITEAAGKKLEEERDELLQNPAAKNEKTKIEIKLIESEVSSLKLKIAEETRAVKGLDRIKHSIKELLNGETLEELEARALTIEEKLKRYLEYEEIQNADSIILKFEELIRELENDLTLSLSRLKKLSEA